MNLPGPITILYIAIFLLGSWFPHDFEIELTDIGKPEVRFYGVKIKVADVDLGTDFYSQKLGFKVKTEHSRPKQIYLETGSLPLILEPAKFNHLGPTTANIAFQVEKLLPAIDQFRGKNITLLDETLAKNGVGIHINFEDPFGNMHSIMEVESAPQGSVNGVKIYNVGFRVHDIEVAENFYVNRLGFSILSRNYLPKALPLKHSDNSFAFMLHYNETVPEVIDQSYPEASQTILLFSTSNIEKATEYLKSQGVKLLFEEPKIDLFGRYIAIKDPLGNVSEIYELRNTLPDKS